MLKQKRLTTLSIALLLALLVAAIMPFAALADDGTTPPADAPAVDVPPAEDLTVLEVLDQLPAKTDLVVLNESSDALPLASAEAAEVIQTSDPMWCPSSAATVTEACVNDTTVTGLLPKINAKIIALGETAGTIYFTSSYATNDAIFDGDSADVNFENSALTLQGGWTQAVNIGDNIVFSGSTVFSVPVTIKSWNANVTVNDVTISGVGGLAEAGMSVYMKAGDVIFDHVNSSSNNFIGLLGRGSIIVAPGNVTVTNSRFDSNKSTLMSDGAFGLEIRSNGNVNLENVSANQNTQGNGSGGYGISISAYDSSNASHANITLTNVQANENNQGALIYSLGDVTIKDSVFNSNNNSNDTSYGLGIYADGNVTLNNVTASHNKGNGVETNSNMAGYPGSVTIQNSFFNDNTGSKYGDGVYLSYGGSPSVKCSQFSGNSFSGILVDGVGTLTNDSNTFSGNGKDVFLTAGATQIIMSSGGCVEVSNQPTGGNGGKRGFKAQNNLFQQGTIVTAQIIAVPTPLSLDELPAALPDGKTFVAGADIKLMLNGEEVLSAPDGAQASFEIPAGMEAPFTVWMWNGTEWVEFPSEVVDGMVVFSVTDPGVYVLSQ